MIQRSTPILLSVFFVLLLFTCQLAGQNLLTDVDRDAHRIYDRLYVLSDGADPLLHPSIKPFWRQDLVTLADSFTHYSNSDVSWYQLQSIYDQNNEFTRPNEPDSLQDAQAESTSHNTLFVQRYRMSTRPLWNTFYKTPAHFYEVDVKDFYLRINPILNIAIGRENEEGVTTFENQRGLSIRGGIGRNVFFHTNVYPY